MRPIEVLTAPVKIDEARLPPKLRFIETNPLANQAVPKTTPFTSSRNQTAAQPVPEKMPTNSPLPKSEGTSEQLRIAQGKPRTIDQSQAAPAPQPSVSMAAPVKAAPPPGSGKSAAQPSPTPAPAPVAANPDRPPAGEPPIGYGRFKFEHDQVMKWNCVFRLRQPEPIKPGDYSYQLFVVIGTREDCRRTLAALTREFAGR